MAQWVKVGNIRGPAGEIPDVSEFLKTDGHFLKYGDDYMNSFLVSSTNSPANAWRAGVYVLDSVGTGVSRIQLFGPNGCNPNPQTYLFATKDYGSYATFQVAKNSEGNMLLVGVNNDLVSFVGSETYPVSLIFAADLDDAATDKRVPNKKYVDDAIAAIPDPDLSGYLPKTGGTLTGNVDLNTGTDEPNLSIKRTVDGGTTAVEGRLRIDSDGVVGLRSIVGGTTVNNLYLEQTQTRLTKPLNVASGGVPQDGTVGQILKKGQNGAEWVDSIVVDATVADVAAKASVAVVDDPSNPTSGIVLKTDPASQKTIITGVGDKTVDEIHISDLDSSATDDRAVNKKYVDDAIEAIPEPDLTGMAKIQTMSGLDILYKVGEDGEETPANMLSLVSNPSAPSNDNAAVVCADGTRAYISITSNTAGVQLDVLDGTPKFTMDDSISPKSVTSITDDASTGDTNALATAKAVKDYVDALSATLSTPDVDEFLAYLDEP